MVEEQYWIVCMPLLSIASDPSCHSLGRINYSLLSDQQLAELLIADIGRPELFHDSDGSFKDVCHWKGVKCNENDEVENVDWNYCYCVGLDAGTIQLQWLPPNVAYFGIIYQTLCGTVEAHLWPQKVTQTPSHGQSTIRNSEPGCLTAINETSVVTS